MTYSVNDDRSEDGSCHCRTILGVFDAAHEFMVLGPEEPAEDGEDNDSEDGDDYAISGYTWLVNNLQLSSRPDPSASRDGRQLMTMGRRAHQDHACIELTIGFIATVLLPARASSYIIGEGSRSSSAMYRNLVRAALANRWVAIGWLFWLSRCSEA